jgi:hypothetical protein
MTEVSTHIYMILLYLHHRGFYRGTTEATEGITSFPSHQLRLGPR